MKRHKLPEIIFPILFVIYPLLALYSANLNYVNSDDLYWSIILAFLGMGLVWLVLRLVLKSCTKAGVLVTLWTVLFFSYGHVYLLALDSFGEEFRHTYLLLIYFVAGLGISGLIILRMEKHSQIPGILGLVGGVLVGMSLLQIGLHQYQVWQGSLRANAENPSDEQISGALPDIYLIILDAHTRSDVLLNDYALDNSEFITQLEELGFFVADCSQSNYPITDLSLQSLFNMEYVHNFIGEGEVLPGLRSSIVKNTFDQTGFTTFSFNNYFSSHYDLGEDVLVQRNTSISERVKLFTSLSEYESLVVETSALRLLVDFQYLLENYFGDVFNDEEKYYSHYLETIFILDELTKLPTNSEKKFVFAHIAAPHWPFVFSEEGEYEHIWGLPESEGYRKNVIFIDRVIPGVLEEMVSQSETPPVIILMGDHGPTGEGVPLESRISNLFAVYADEETLAQFYHSITPANAFRVILNQYFATEYELLEDVSYNIWNNDAYDLTETFPNNCGVE